jgi:plastocyanin
MKRSCVMLAALAALLLLTATRSVAAPAHEVVVTGVRVLPNPAPAGGGGPPRPGPGTPQPVAAAQDHVVRVADSDMDPQKWTWVPEVVDVKAGDTVTWDMNGAQVAHTATADDGSWDSGYVNPGSKWTHKFGTVGEIHYHCTPHPWKKGVIRVHQ